MTYHAAAIHWDEYGKPRARHPPCLVCGADEIGSLYDGAWCHCCQWRGPLLALLAHAKERADVETVIDDRDHLSSALEQAARDGEEFHRLQAAILAFRAKPPGAFPGERGDVARESYAKGWEDAIDRLVRRLQSEGLMPS